MLLYSQQNLLSLFIMFYFMWGFGPQGGEYFNIRLYFVAPYWDISSKFSSKSLIPTYIPASPPGGLTLIGALRVILHYVLHQFMRREHAILQHKHNHIIHIYCSI